MKTSKLSIYKLFFALLFFCSLIGCEKNDDGPKFSLPPATQTGENTFGCLIDGQLLIPRDGSGSFNVHDIGMKYIDVPGDVYEIDVHDFASERTASINLHIIGLDSIGLGEYIINESNCYRGLDSPETNNIFCRIYDYEENIYKYYCSFENSGTINITRYDNGIVSGIFSCKVISDEDPTDTIEITKGRFDLDRSTVNFTSYPNQ